MVFDHSSGRLSERDREIVSHVPPGGNWRDLPADFESKRVDQIRESAAAGLGSRSTYYGRLDPDRPSYTISTYFNRPGNGCFIHPRAERLISIREAARLQGFPDSYRFTGRGRARFLQVGNAVPPLLAYQVARVLRPETVVDLFAGAGGLSAGFEWAGSEVVAAVDHDRACVETLRANSSLGERALLADMTDPEQYADVLRVARAGLGNRNLDLLVGGPPCQGFSTAGKNLADDPRNRLLFVFLDAVRDLGPRRVVMENVPALMWKGRRATLDAACQILVGLGYTASLAILHAEGYGLPQLRRRLVVQAALDGEVVWPVPHRMIIPPSQLDHQPGVIDSAMLPPVTVDEAIDDLPPTPATDPDDECEIERAPRTTYQRWARGEIATDELLPEPQSTATSTQTSLLAA